MRRKKRWILLLVLLIGAGAVWLELDTILLWYYTRNLKQANKEDASKWATRLASLEEKAIPEVLDCLKDSSHQICSNARCTVCCLIKRWGAEDPRSVECLRRLIKCFPHLSEQGRCAVLESVLEWTRQHSPRSSALCCALTELIAELPHYREEPLLHLAGELALRVAGVPSTKAELLPALRELALLGLSSSQEKTRLVYLKLATLPRLKLRKDLVPLLKDSSPLIRRRALREVAFPNKTEPEIILTDNLIRWLHDPDFEVRQICERALLRRGLTRRQVHLARQITDSRWQIRLKVIEQLPRYKKLDPSLWLRRLSHDQAPAVRMAAIRASVEMKQVDLVDRLHEISRNDPDHAVRAQARYYLRIDR